MLNVLINCTAGAGQSAGSPRGETQREENPESWSTRWDSALKVKDARRRVEWTAEAVDSFALLLFISSVNLGVFFLGNPMTKLKVPLSRLTLNESAFLSWGGKKCACLCVCTWKTCSSFFVCFLTKLPMLGCSSTVFRKCFWKNVWTKKKNSKIVKNVDRKMCKTVNDVKKKIYVNSYL